MTIYSSFVWSLFFCQNHEYNQCDNSNEYGETGGLLGYSKSYGNYAGGQAQYIRVPHANVGPKIIPEELKEFLINIIKEYKSVLQLHGFYLDKIKKNIFFDIIIDFEEENKEQIKNEIVKKLKEKYKEYNYNVILDLDVSD